MLTWFDAKVDDGNDDALPCDFDATAPCGALLPAKHQ